MIGYEFSASASKVPPLQKIHETTPIEEDEAMPVMEKRVDTHTTARKLEFFTSTIGPSPTMADIVNGNRSKQQSMQLKFFPPCGKRWS